MAENAEVLIIGAGAVGLCAAHYLQKAGKAVIVVEKGEIASGSSYGNAGLIVPSYSIPMARPGVVTQGLKWLRDPESPFYIKPRLDPTLGRWLWHFYRSSTNRHVRRALPVIRDLHLASCKMFATLAADKDLDFGFERRGLVELFATSAAYDEGREDARLLRSKGIEANFLNTRQLSEALGGLRTETRGAIHFPLDAHLDPAQLCRCLGQRVQRGGGEIKTGTEVIGLRVRGKRVVAVETTRGNIHPDQVVIAAGTWSPAVSRDLNLGLLMQPAKGYSITYERPAKSPPIPLALAEVRTVVTPMGDQLRLAGTLELAGNDLSINRRRVRAIARNVSAYLPELDQRKMGLKEIWSGLRPCSPDGLPYLGRPQSHANVIVATGHGMLGVSQAPISGRIVSDLVCDRTPPLNLAPMRPERFG